LSISNLAGYKSVTTRLHGYIVGYQQLNRDKSATLATFIRQMGARRSRLSPNEPQPTPIPEGARDLSRFTFFSSSERKRTEADEFAQRRRIRHSGFDFGP